MVEKLQLFVSTIRKSIVNLSAMNTRRHFLKQALVATTAIGFPTIIPSWVLGKDAPGNKITVGFIGTGGHGIKRNLNMYLRQSDARILAVCDVFKSRREKVATAPA